MSKKSGKKVIVKVPKKTKRTPKKETGTFISRITIGGDEPEAGWSLKAVSPKQLLRALDEIAKQLQEKNANWRALDLISDLCYSLKMLTTRERDRRSNKVTK